MVYQSGWRIGGSHLGDRGYPICGGNQKEYAMSDTDDKKETEEKKKRHYLSPQKKFPIFLKTHRRDTPSGSPKYSSRFLDRDEAVQYFRGYFNWYLLTIYILVSIVTLDQCHNGLRE
jgi:hypothetical protein